MDKFVDVKDTSKTIEIILPSEEQFKIKLMNTLGDNYFIVKSQDKYLSIDFCIINRKNLKVVYLEHKQRKCNQNTYPSTIINYCKLESFSRNYKNAIMVWSYNDNDKFLVYSKDLLDLPQKDCKNQAVVYLKNDMLKNGYDNLISTIKHKLK